MSAAWKFIDNERRPGVNHQSQNSKRLSIPHTTGNVSKAEYLCARQAALSTHREAPHDALLIWIVVIPELAFRQLRKAIRAECTEARHAVLHSIDRCHLQLQQANNDRATISTLRIYSSAWTVYLYLNIGHATLVMNHTSCGIADTYQV